MHYSNISNINFFYSGIEQILESYALLYLICYIFWTLSQKFFKAKRLYFKEKLYFLI